MSGAVPLVRAEQRELIVQIGSLAGRKDGRRLGPAALALLAGGEAGVVLALVLLIAVFDILNQGFLSEMNIRAMLIAVSYIGIIGVGQTILLVAGEFDLSVGSVSGLCAVVSGWLMTSGHVPVPLALLGGVATGAALGFVNGTVVVRFGIPAFIATLGMLFVAAGLTQVVTNGYPIYPIPDSVGNFGAASFVWGIGWSFFILLVLLVGGDLMLRRTTIGRNLYATGGNKEVARLVGINTNRYKLICFVNTGVLSAVAGMLVMASLASATTSIGVGWELNCIAGVVVGGVSLFGVPTSTKTLLLRQWLDAVSTRCIRSAKARSAPMKFCAWNTCACLVPAAARTSFQTQASACVAAKLLASLGWLGRVGPRY